MNETWWLCLGCRLIRRAEITAEGLSRCCNAPVVLMPLTPMPMTAGTAPWVQARSR